MVKKNKLVLPIGLAFLSFIGIYACSSLFIGKNQQIDYRSHQYNILKLDQNPTDGWHLLSTSQNQDKADTTFEHQLTGAIISINSVCNEYTKTSLENLSQQLLMGTEKHGDVKRRNLQVDEVPALESTVEASMGEDTATVQIRTIVLRKSNCIYDLMYIAKAEVFHERLPDFERFVKGFHAK